MSAEPTITIQSITTPGHQAGFFHGIFTWETKNGLRGRCYQEVDDIGLLRSRLEDFAESHGFDLNKVKREGIQ